MSYEQYYIYQEKKTIVNSNGQEESTRTTSQWSNKNGNKTFHQDLTTRVGRRKSKISIDGKFENGDYAITETRYNTNGRPAQTDRYRLAPLEFHDKFGINVNTWSK